LLSGLCTASVCGEIEEAFIAKGLLLFAKGTGWVSDTGEALKSELSFPEKLIIR
jgi:hypothetical protein